MDHKVMHKLNIVFQYAVAAAFAVLLFFWTKNTVSFCFSRDIWFDELFTLEFAKMSVSDMLSLAAKDVHPPLYYLVVRLCGLLGRAIWPTMAWEVSIKLTSFFIVVIPVIVFSCCLMHEYKEPMIGFLTIFILLFMPQMTAGYFEARMYNLGAFLLLGMLFAGKAILNHMEEASKRVKYWCHFFLFGIGAAYTQYFAAICAALIYLFLLVALLFGRKKNNNDEAGNSAASYKKVFLAWGGCVLLSILSYLPWLGAFLRQLGSVSQSYWIQPLTIRSIGGCIKYLFKPQFENETLNVLAAVLLFLIYVAIVCLGFWKAEKERRWFIAAGTGTLVGMVVFGFILSILIRPIFVYRYMLLAMPLMWISFVASLAELICSGSESRNMQPACKVTALFLCFCLIVPIGVRDYHLFVWEEEKKQAEMVKTEAIFEAIPDDAILICNFNQVQAILWNYLPANDSYLWGYTEELLIAEVCGQDGIQMIEEPDQVRDLISSGRKVIFVGSGNARDEICALWEENGIRCDLSVDSCLIERYWFILYTLSLDERNIR